MNLLQLGNFNQEFLNNFLEMGYLPYLKNETGLTDTNDS